MAFRSGCVRARRRRAGRVDPSHRPWVRTDSAACQKRATRTTAEAPRTSHNLFCIYYFRMRLCQVQTRASNALPRCRETNRRTPGTMARWHDGTMARWADSKAVLRPCPFSRKNGRQPAPAPKTKPLYPPGIRWQHPKWDPRPTKKTQKRRLEKSLGRDSKPPESRLPYNRQPPPRQRSSKVARAP